MSSSVRPIARRGLFPLILAISAAAHVAALILIPLAAKHVDTGPRALEVSLATLVEGRIARKALPAVPSPAITSHAGQSKTIKAPRPVKEPQITQATLPSQPIAFSDSADPSPVGVPPVGEVRAPKTDPAPSSPSSARSHEAVPVTSPSFNAAYLKNPPPRYPMPARRAGVAGTVLLKVRVTSEGRPAEVQVDRSSGSSALDGAALDAVRIWQFVPARREETPVESWVVVPIVFRLD